MLGLGLCYGIIGVVVFDNVGVVKCLFFGKIFEG